MLGPSLKSKTYVFLSQESTPIFFRCFESFFFSVDHPVMSDFTNIPLSTAYFLSFFQPFSSSVCNMYIRGKNRVYKSTCCYYRAIIILVLRGWRLRRGLFA